MSGLIANVTAEGVMHGPRKHAEVVDDAQPLGNDLEQNRGRTTMAGGTSTNAGQVLEEQLAREHG